MPLDGSDPILFAQAYGPCIERQCCAPFHSLVLKIYDPVTGTAHLSLERKGKWPCDQALLPRGLAMAADLTPPPQYQTKHQAFAPEST
jgi:hypothetical protein